MIPLAFLLLFAARWPEGNALPRLDEFDAQIQRRFVDGRGFGLSRIIRWNTLSQHFRAPADAKSDFTPENPVEFSIIEKWNSGGWQTGLYVFGASIRDAKPEAFFHRALKGPGVLTETTARAELPSWADTYPVATEALARFQSGSPEYKTTLKGWTVTARPVTASQQTCLECHNSGNAHLDGRKPFQMGDPLGGVLYLSRR